MRIEIPGILLLPISRSGPVPLYYQLATSLENAVKAGKLNKGTELPPETQVASQMKLSRNTVRNAWAYLEEKGIIVRRQGSGTIVC